MRPRLLAIIAALAAASALCATLNMAPARAAPDLGSPEYANRIVERASGPILEPGQSGLLYLTIRNPAPGNAGGNQSASGYMRNVTLRMSIYLYRSLDDQQDVGSMRSPPLIANTGTTDYSVPAFDLGPNSTRDLTVAIETRGDTPHPGYFDQGAYFVRLWMRFDCGGRDLTIFSRGYFEKAQWDGYRQQANVSQNAARQYLRNMSCDGIIPDTSFTVRLTIPLWPLALLVLATCGTASLALMYYLEENPRKAPRLEKAFQGARGKAKQAWAFCKQALRKP